jgi:long-chain fatty acid transport protein
MTKMKKTNLAAALIAALGAGNAGAAGFQLFEQGVGGLGTAYASGAAAEDASTIYWNPAGMTYLPGKNISAGLHLINPAAKFKNEGSTFPNVGGAPVTGGNGGDAGGVAPVPNGFYSHAINDQLRVGIGMSSIFGLKTEYDNGWVGRYHALVSDLRTINVNPSLAYRINDKFSIGGGLNLVRADVELSNAINFGLLGAVSAIGAIQQSAVIPAAQKPALIAGVQAQIPALNQSLDGKVNLQGDDMAYGFNLGLMAQVTPAARVGFSFRSKVKIEVEGKAKFTVPTFALPGALAPVGAQVNAGLQTAFANTDVKATVELPEIVSLNTHVQLNDRWGLMGDLTWTNWSRFEELRIKFKDGRADSVTPEKWKDSYKVAFGANFKMNEKWTLRGGLAYDKSPVEDEFRTPRIPDADRTWIAFGARYNMSDHNSIDVGFAHIFVDDPKLNKVSDESVAQIQTLLRGKYDSNVNVLSVGYNHRF